jgi:hypothetical protein
VLVGLCEGAGDGGGDDALLGIVLAGATGHPMGDVIVKLTRHGFKGG